MKKILLSLLLIGASCQAQDKPVIDGMLPDSGGSGIPTVSTLAPTKGEAVAAMLAIPPKFADGILEVTGQEGAPNPKQWILQAWNTEDPGTVHKLTVVDDQFVSDVLSVNIFEAERKEINVPMAGVQLDSGGAYRIAKAYASANGKTLGHVNYSLVVHAKHTPPVWTLECFDAKGTHIGKLEVLATSGSVRASPGFPVTPP
ncbi:MAG: hypothetical protein ACOYM3_03885 [Terrimicrobiaceae bacterium]